MKHLNSEECYIIAEIGVNHGGNVALAKKMILAAKNAGADAVKFQTFTAASLVSPNTKKVGYQKKNTPNTESHYSMIQSLEFKREDHIPVMDYCNSLGVDFISTPYDCESAQFLDDLGVSIFKTASADIVDHRLHEVIARTGKTVLISTGMATIDEIDQALAIYRKHDSNNIILLHCVSNYPCHFNSLNLNVIKTLREVFQLPVGYSDHAVGPYPALLSIALGATVIEKHFTLDKKLVGPDHSASSTPAEFEELVTAVRIAEICLGSRVKEPQQEEMDMREISRKSVFIAKDISAGTPINDSDLTLKRPGTGLYADMLPHIVGTKASRNLKSGDILQLSDFSQ
jgi:N-acetylneuraminate synthase/N,N'-diacetyllegionaminate synthase